MSFLKATLFQIRGVSLALVKKGFHFIKHFFRSKTRHGTHSPFVYALIDQCIYQSIEIPTEVRGNFEKLKKDRRSFTGVDHGKGIEKTYSIGDLAKKSASQDFESMLIARLARYHSVKSFLELGSNLGKTAAYVASTNPQLNVLGIDGNEALASFAMKNFQTLAIKNAEVKATTFNEFFQTNSRAFDMVFIDGDHRCQPTLDNYESSKKVLKGEGPIVLHDIYWSDGMNEAWEKIKADNDATVTIDLFFFGLVYFRKGKVKEHFDIRFPLNLFRVFF